LGKKARRRLRPLAAELARVRPDLADPIAAIVAGDVRVDGRIVMKPASLVPVGASIVLRPAKPLRGEAKLGAALAAFHVDVHGVAVDVGAAAGGFTRVLLAAGARRVYAVDAGHGQLVGSLRADPRVVNLEGVNLGVVAIEEPIDFVTLDLSYLAVADAVPQLERLDFDDGAQLIALVKPMFELRAPSPPPRPERAVGLACRALAQTWTPRACMRSPAEAAEFLVWATRC
jgi:23S rRNA (cytidine1920-2'-O)/16S rRNA (cytidine1409-2'-O)-methyltransferase